MNEISFREEKYIIYCDKQSTIHLNKNTSFYLKSKQLTSRQNTIHLIKNISFYLKSKHIDVRYHLMKDALKNKFLELIKILTDKNVTNMITKTVIKEKYLYC